MTDNAVSENFGLVAVYLKLKSQHLSLQQDK